LAAKLSPSKRVLSEHAGENIGGRGEQMLRLPDSNSFSPQPAGNNMRLVPLAGISGEVK